MKKMIYKQMILLALSFAFYACSSSETQTEESTEIATKAIATDWNKAKVPVMRTIDRHYVDNTLRKSQLQYEFRDHVVNRNLYFTLGNIEQDSIYPRSETNAFMKVNAITDKGEPLVFDYEVSATPAKEKPDSTVYEVKSISLRKFNQEQRYLLKKEGNFWTKEILAVAQ
jgi:hypothetical protein